MTTIRNQLYFGLAVLTLGGTAAYVQIQTARGALQLLKKPLPIRKPLVDMNRDAMMPYRVMREDRLSAEIVENLGTQEYINWVLQEAGPRDAKPIHFSVTYYTGVQDQVPHVPEECMFQGGMTQESDTTLTLKLPRLGREVQVRRLSFNTPRQLGQRAYVYYTICVNGAFYGDRQLVRLKMANPTESHLYYSKVEISLDGSGVDNPTRFDEQAAEVFDRALTELFKSHWPPPGSERGGMAAPGSGAASS